MSKSLEGILNYLNNLTDEERRQLKINHIKEQKQKYIDLIEAFQKIRNKQANSGFFNEINSEFIKSNGCSIFLAVNQYKYNSVPQIQSLDELESYVTLSREIRVEPRLMLNKYHNLLQELLSHQQIFINFPLEILTANTNLTQLTAKLYKTTIHKIHYTCNNHYILIFWISGQKQEKWAFVINTKAEILDLDKSISVLEMYNNEYYLSNL